MNKLIFAICLILATGFAGAKNFDSYCSKCLAESETSGFYPHPNRCDKYINCYISGNITEALEMPCGLGTLYDDRFKNCNHANLVECNATCVTGEKFKVNGVCNQYYKCTNKAFNKNIQTCPLYEAFDETSSSCVSDKNCPPKGVVDCSKFKVDAKDPQKYTNDGVSNSCALGFMFNITVCTCVQVIPNSQLIQTVCKLIDLPLTNNFIEVTKGRSILSTNVVIQRGAAYFDGNSSHITIPSFIMNAFGDKIKISVNLSVKETSALGVAVFTNGNCDLKPTISVIVKSVNGVNELLATMKIIGVQIPVTLKTSINLGSWVKITFEKKGSAINLYKDSTVVDQVNVAGDFQHQDSALKFSNSLVFDSYKGSMKNILVEKC